MNQTTNINHIHQSLHNRTTGVDHEGERSVPSTFLSWRGGGCHNTKCLPNFSLPSVYFFYVIMNAIDRNFLTSLSTIEKKNCDEQFIEYSSKSEAILLVGLSVCLKSTYFVLGGFEERDELNISCEIFWPPQDSRIHTVCT